MKDKKVSSYLDEIGANREAEGYDLEQVGLAYEQAVTEEKNWGNDQRDAVGRAAISNRKKRLAKKLLRLSRELEALGKMEEEYKEDIEEVPEVEVDEMDYEGDDEEDDDNEDPISMEMGTEEWLAPEGKEASHPIEHDPDADDPEAFAPSTMGDDEWISIGPGEFDDKRNEIGKAAKKKVSNDPWTKTFSKEEVEELIEDPEDLNNKETKTQILRRFKEALKELDISTKDLNEEQIYKEFLGYKGYNEEHYLKDVKKGVQKMLKNKYFYDVILNYEEEIEGFQGAVFASNDGKTFELVYSHIV